MVPVVGLALLLCGPVALGAGEPAALLLQDTAREKAVRVAMIYRVAELVTWPDEVFANAEAPVRVCLVGEDALDGNLEALSSERLHGRTIEVLHFATARELEYCHVLYVSPSERPRQQQILAAVASTAVLTFGESKDFAESGGVVEFVQRVNSLGFELNPPAARGAGLELERALIRLAERTVGARR